MANASSFVTQTRQQITAFMNAYEDLVSRGNEYAALGGETFVEDHFLDSEGQPRTDLDITQAEFVAAVASIDAVMTLMINQFHRVNLYKAKG